MKTPSQIQLQAILDSINGDVRWLEREVKKIPELYQEVVSSWNYPVQPKHFPERCYAFLTGESPICSRGNIRKYEYFSTGYKSCSSRCDCAKEKRKSSMIERFGVEHALQSPSLKKKAEHTCIERYGTSTISLINLDQRKATCMERYGESIPLKSSVIRKKIENTCVERYGGKSPFHNSEIQNKIQKSWSELNENGQQSFVRTMTHGQQDALKYSENNFTDYEHILLDRDKLTEHLRTKSRKELAIELGCSLSLIDKRIKQYNITEFSDLPTYYEILIKRLLDSTNLLYIERSRKIIPPKELDFYIPSANLAIEFCGLRWHGEKLNRDNKYHLNKYLSTKEKGIRLIQIFQDEWDTNSAIVKDIILQQLGIIQHKVHGRKTVVKKIDRKIATVFLDENHLQGNGAGASAYYGIFYLELLIGVMSFTYKNQEWELKRFAVKIGYKIMGGASKLFKQFIKEYQPDKIFSYCDLRYFTGTVYPTLGFKYNGRTQPGYFYTKGVSRFNRLQFTKAKLVAKGNDPTLSEKTIMQNLGYDRLWDCGHDKWVWTSKTS